MRTWAQNLKEKAALVKKIKDHYKGDNSALVKHSMFCMFTKDLHSSSIKYYTSINNRNLKTVYNWWSNVAAANIYNPAYQWGQDRPILITSQYGGPIYSSFGDDLTGKEAQRYLGRAFEHPRCFSPPVNNPAVKTKGILDAKHTAPAMFMALVDDGKKIVRLNFTNNAAAAVKEFKSQVGENKKYKAGLLIRNHWRNYGAPTNRLPVYARASSYEYADHGLDIHELVARYLQQLGLYKKVAHSEKDAGLLTIKERESIK